jgi:hypothetical protein
MDLQLRTKGKRSPLELRAGELAAIFLFRSCHPLLKAGRLRKDTVIDWSIREVIRGQPISEPRLKTSDA